MKPTSLADYRKTRDNLLARLETVEEDLKVTQLIWHEVFDAMVEGMQEHPEIAETAFGEQLLARLKMLVLKLENM